MPHLYTHIYSATACISAYTLLPAFPFYLHHTCHHHLQFLPVHTLPVHTPTLEHTCSGVSPHTCLPPPTPFLLHCSHPIYIFTCTCHHRFITGGCLPWCHLLPAATMPILLLPLHHTILPPLPATYTHYLHEGIYPINFPISSSARDMPAHTPIPTPQGPLPAAGTHPLLSLSSHLSSLGLFAFLHTTHTHTLLFVLPHHSGTLAPTHTLSATTVLLFCPCLTVSATHTQNYLPVFPYLCHLGSDYYPHRRGPAT